jgi:hypothetical protein
MQRHRFKQTESLQDRIASFGREAREKAARLPPGPERDALLKKARLADNSGSHLEDWANSPSPELRPPK